MQKIYVSVKRETRHHRSFHSTLIIVFGILVFVVASFLTRSSFDAQREELIEKLGKEREVNRLNEKLKVELAGIMRARYIELKARERLGLKMPTEEDILVLRHE